MDGPLYTYSHGWVNRYTYSHARVNPVRSQQAALANTMETLGSAYSIRQWKGHVIDRMEQNETIFEHSVALAMNGDETLGLEPPD